MSSLQYLLVLLAATFAACLIFFGALEHHKSKHGKKMSGQDRVIWAACLVLSVCALVTGVQIFDWFWEFPDERLESLGMK